MMSSNLWRHGENWPQRFDLPLPLHDLSLDKMVSGVWQIFRADCAVILRYCKSKLDQKCRSYLTLKHLRILNLQFPQFFKGLKRGLLTKIRCSQWLQGMVLYGTKGFQAKKSKSMTFNYKSCISYLVLAQFWVFSNSKFLFFPVFQGHNSVSFCPKSTSRTIFEHLRRRPFHLYQQKRSHWLYNPPKKWLNKKSEFMCDLL